MKRIMIAVASLLLGAPFASADSFSGAWSVHASPIELSADESQNAFTDGLLFREGMLSSAAFAMLGFAPVEYQLCTEGSRDSITATFASDQRGTLSYKLIKMTTGLTGYLIWTKPDGSISRYEIEGERYVEDQPLETIEAEE